MFGEYSLVAYPKERPVVGVLNLGDDTEKYLL